MKQDIQDKEGRNGNSTLVSALYEHKFISTKEFTGSKLYS